MVTSKYAAIKAKLDMIESEIEAGGGCENYPQLPIEDTTYCVGCAVGMLAQDIGLDLDDLLESES